MVLGDGDHGHEDPAEATNDAIEGWGQENPCCSETTKTKGEVDRLLPVEVYSSLTQPHV